MTTYTIVETTSGRVRGHSADGIGTYLGVPYAAPPVRDLRFAAPEPAPAWDGIRDALTPGPSAPQNGASSFFGLDMVAATGADWRQGDDYLTLNVWAPTDGVRHPVMVYVHGGGLMLGTKDAAVYDGRNFARDGVVSVTLNYRLGVEGFLAIPGAPTNLGLRDILAGLEWVRDNIAAFGGDPDNVTVFGESGGGMAVACLVTSPLATGLFAQAIIQSGHGSAVYPLEIARRATDAVANSLRIPADVEGFRSVDSRRALAALARAARPGAVNLKDDAGFDPSFGLGILNPVIGDDVLPEHPLRALRGGAGSTVPIVIGTTRDEANFWFAPTRLLALPAVLARPILRRMVPSADALWRAYTEDEPTRGGVTLSRIISDLSFRWPARLYAEAHQGDTYAYDFDWHSPASGGRFGAAHGMELPFVFDTLPTVTGPRGMAGTQPPQRLADTMHAAWREFAATGRAPWPQFTSASRQVRRFGSETTVSEPVMPAAAFYRDVSVL
ncbi:carboxylesterase family protein [soil metagenome]